MIDKDASTVHRAEKMHKSAMLETYLKIADVLDISLSDIFCDDLDPVERELVQAFRKVPPERRGVFSELIKLAQDPDQPSDQ